MIDYARSDTAYLHFLYDSMRKDLYKAHGQEGLQAVLNASRKWCFRRYEKEPFWPLGYRKLLNSEGCSPHSSSGTGTDGTGDGNNNGNGNGKKKGRSSSGSGSGSRSNKIEASPTLTAEQDLVLSGQSTGKGDRCVDFIVRNIEGDCRRRVENRR